MLEYFDLRPRASSINDLFVFKSLIILNPVIFETSEKSKKDYIDMIHLRIPAQPIFFYENLNGDFESLVYSLLIDAVSSYLDNKFSSLKGFYKYLSRADQRRFGNTQINIYWLFPASFDDESIHVLRNYLSTYF